MNTTEPEAVQKNCERLERFVGSPRHDCSPLSLYSGADPTPAFVHGEGAIVRETGEGSYFDGLWGSFAIEQANTRTPIFVDTKVSSQATSSK